MMPDGVGYQPSREWVLFIRSTDFEAGINQPLYDDVGRPLRVQDLGREVAAAEQVGQDLSGV